jgi:hypothetical protein
MDSEDYITLIKMLSIEPSRKRVRFEPTVSSSNPGPLSQEDLRALWYDRQDLAQFRSELRKLASSAGSLNCNSLRGLESSSYSRKLHKHMTIQCTISAHKNGMSADQTAAMSRKCTEWNERVAYAQACHDYCNVYQPSMALPELSNKPPQFPFALKRSSVDTSGPRKVRRRTL